MCAINKIRYFVAGFQNAFTPNYEEMSFERPGHYMKTISEKRRIKLVPNEKSRSRQKSSGDKRVCHS